MKKVKNVMMMMILSMSLLISAFPLTFLFPMTSKAANGDSIIVFIRTSRYSSITASSANNYTKTQFFARNTTNNEISYSSAYALPESSSLYLWSNATSGDYFYSSDSSNVSNPYIYEPFIISQSNNGGTDITSINNYLDKIYLELLQTNKDMNQDFVTVINNLQQIKSELESINTNFDNIISQINFLINFNARNYYPLSTGIEYYDFLSIGSNFNISVNSSPISINYNLYNNTYSVTITTNEKFSLKSGNYAMSIPLPGNYTSTDFFYSPKFYNAKIGLKEYISDNLVYTLSSILAISYTPKTLFVEFFVDNSWNTSYNFYALTFSFSYFDIINPYSGSFSSSFDNDINIFSTSYMIESNESDSSSVKLQDSVSDLDSALKEQDEITNMTGNINNVNTAISVDVDVLSQLANTASLFGSIVTIIWNSLGQLSYVLLFSLTIPLISIIIGIYGRKNGGE